VRNEKEQEDACRRERESENRMWSLPSSSGWLCVSVSVSVSVSISVIMSVFMTRSRFCLCLTQTHTCLCLRLHLCVCVYEPHRSYEVVKCQSIVS